MKFDVTIVGGGIIGSSIAFHASRSCPNLKFAIFDRSPQPAGSTTKSAGLVIQLAKETTKATFIQQTLYDIKSFQELLGESITFQTCGTVRVADSHENQEALEKEIESCQGMVDGCYVDFQSEIIPSWLHLPKSSKAYYIPSDGFIDPVVFTSIYQSFAKQQGVCIFRECAVNSVSKLHDHFSLSTALGDVESSLVIDATGSHAGLLSSGICATPTRSHYWNVALANDLHPNVILPDKQAYSRHLSRSNILLGIQETISFAMHAKDLPLDSQEAHEIPQAAGSESLIEQYEDLLPWIPSLENADIGCYTAGFSTYTPDGRYILGELEKDFIVASGCNGSGVSACGGFGKAVADFISNETAFPNIFDPTRFSKYSPHTEEVLEACTKSRGKKFKK